MSILTRQLAVAASGVAAVLGTAVINDTAVIKALKTNTGVVYIGNDGNDTVTETDGFPLEAGAEIVFSNLGTLADLYYVGTVRGDRIAIIDSDF
jgi:hypothetical protein